MKNLVAVQRKFMFAALLVFALAMCAAAQSVTFRQGDTVQTPDGRTGKIESFKDEVMAKVRFGTGANDTQYFMLSVLKKAQDPSKEVLKVGDTVSASYVRNGTPGRIESINGNLAKVRYGPGNYDFVNVELSDLIGPRGVAAARENAEQEQIQKPMREQFADEAEPFMRTVEILANIYSSQFYDNGNAYTGNAADQEAWRKDLEALAAICRKYPNMTNGKPYTTQVISQYPADVCKLAEQRTSVIQKTKSKLGDLSATQEIGSWSMKLDEAVQSSEGLIEDDLQTLLYERATWEQTHLKNLKKNTRKEAR